MTTREMPPGWSEASVAELTDFVTSGSRGWGAFYAADGPLFLRVGDLARGTVQLDLRDVAHVQPPNGSEGERTRVEADDILVSITADVGMVGLVPEGLGDAFVSQHVALLRPRPGVFAKGLAFALLDPGGFQKVVRQAQYGVTKAGLSLVQVRDFKVLLPPVAESERIVDTVESYLSRLDVAVANLERVQAKLKAYRASVLKAAVEGRLVPTEAEVARQEKRAYEPAEALLARILKDRRRRWEEAELARLKKAGKAPKDDKWKAKYEEPSPPDTSKLPELPEGWCWTTVDMIALVKGGVTKGQRRLPGEVLLDVPYLRVANVQRGYLDLSEMKTIQATPAEVEELRLEPGDVLFNEGGDRDKLGRGWVWGGEIENCIHQNHVFRARILTGDVRPRFLSWYGNSSGQKYFYDEGKQTTNLASINMTKLKALPVPVPPLAEQDGIAEEVERLLSIADESTVIVGNDLRRCTRLRQAVLKWAFEGKLVDQDPADEPADKLLARIRVERCAAAPIKKTRGRKAKAAS